MSLVFVTLITEMAILFALVLPLPHVVRRKFVHTVDLLRKSQNVKVGLVFFTIILGLQFFDCVNRLQRQEFMKNPYFLNSLTSSMISNEQLASKFYSQRNLYLSGAVLYLELAIYSVTTIVRKLVLKEEKLRSGNDEGEIEKYEELIRLKEKDIEVMKKQIEGVQKAYDGLNKQTVISKDD